MEQEKWVEVNGYPNYMVSDQGRVKSLKFNRTDSSKILSGKTNRQGYQNVHLWNKDLEKKPRPYRVNVLVAMHFVRKIGDRNFVNHINGIRSDDRAINLEWTNHRENVTHSFKYNLKKDKKMTGAFRKINYYKSGPVVTNKWFACIRINNKLKHLGTRNSEEEAHELYLNALREFNLPNNYAS